MTTISIDEIERDLAGYLGRVKAGESLVITDRDRPVAELKPVAVAASSQEQQAIAEYLMARVRAATISARWRDEGVSDPSEQCRRSAFNLAERMFAERAILPSKVVASRQGGIYLEYQSPISDRRLGVEVDNELEAVAVVSDANQVLASAPFEGEQMDELLCVFGDGLPPAIGNSWSPEVE